MINVLSLFDGLSCGQIALERLGVDVSGYYASELDKNPIKVSTYNYPNMIHLGDVRGVNAQELPKITLLMGGSPCTDLSVAGKLRGMSTTTKADVKTLDQYLQLKLDGYEFAGQSFLFWEYIRLLRETEPKYFLLENVDMSMKWKKVISDALGIAPISINSKLLSAQQRSRLYWTNIKTESFGLFSDPYCSIPQPIDKNLYLKDILEKGLVDEKYYIKNPKFGFKAMSSDEKARTQRVGGGRTQSDKHNFDLVEAVDFVKIDKKGNVKANQEKASCFTAGAHSGGNHSDMDLIREVRQMNTSTESHGQQPFQQNRVYDINAIAPAMLAYKSDTLIQENPIVHSLQPRNGKGIGGKGHLQKNDGKSYCVDTTSGQAIELDEAEAPSRIRRLTPVEACRLQTIPDGYFYDKDGKQLVSDSSIYKMVGNGWTVDVIAHILSFANLPLKRV